MTIRDGEIVRKDYEVLEGGKLIKQVITKAERYVHKTGKRKVRIKVGGWMHIALDGLGEADTDGLDRNNVLPPFATCFSCKPLEKLLRYGLIAHELRGPYYITTAGRDVLKKLDAVKPITVDGPFHVEQTWKDVMSNTGYYRWKGYRMVSVLIPGNRHWEDYFSRRTW